ncbi:MAG: hypothetical protein RQ738_12505, partial [Sulfuriflexus sp.]|nr:hypothetical protein [Sulfuriflexus sp.]
SNFQKTISIAPNSLYFYPLIFPKSLNFKQGRWPWYLSVPLLSDSADTETLRRLRVRLRTLRDGELEKLA